MNLRLLLCLGISVFVACASAPRASAKVETSITNNQEQGVDEGDIVKAIGDHLVILRRGRIFSVRIAGGTAAQRADQIDARAPGHTEQAWYDEMLVYGRRIVVVGFSYATRSTELGMFELSESGKLAHVATYYLRSNDYYSSRNYASRLIEGTLVFYVPYFGSVGPAIARSDRGNGTVGQWEELLGPVEVHRSNLNGNALHAVVRCSLDTPELTCNASAFSAPYSRAFYVAPNAVYIWVGESDPGGGVARAEVFRMPLDGGAVESLVVRGMPIDQFSFHEAEGRLNVLVRGSGEGDGMWSAERGAGSTELALLRLPLRMFASELTEAPPYAYQPLPGPSHGSLQNRFAGRYLLWGAGSAWRAGTGSDQRVFVTDVHDPIATVELKISHLVERIEVLGAHALVVGQSGGNLVMSTLFLSETPVVANVHVQLGAGQGETRSHGFFFLPDADGRGGVLGLPTRHEEGGGWWSLFRESAAVSFLRVTPELALVPLGDLKSSGSNTDDACEVSCVDWYGNSRPIFYRERVFALMGYELVEGRLGAHRIDEISRLDYFSQTKARARLASARKSSWW